MNLSIILLLLLLSLHCNGESTPILTPESYTYYGLKLLYHTYRPASASMQNPLPLVVYFHSAGGRSDSYKGAELPGPLMLRQNRYPCHILAPICPRSAQWVATPWNKGNYSLEKTPITPQMTAVLALLDRTLNDPSIDRKRVYVVGKSMGGFGAWDAMMRRPEIWAAGVPCAGGGDPSQAMKIEHIPIWAWHSKDDTIVPFTGTLAMVTALQERKANVKYTDPACGHPAGKAAFDSPELFPWLFSQSKSTPP
jgi:predicted peptidase